VRLFALPVGCRPDMLKLASRRRSFFPWLPNRSGLGIHHDGG
jgi:hypothetical protein